MLYLRIIIIAVNLLLFAYYVTVVGQAAGVLEFTPREIKFTKAIIPFYYGVKSQPEKKKASDKKKIVKPIKSKNYV